VLLGVEMAIEEGEGSIRFSFFCEAKGVLAVRAELRTGAKSLPKVRSSNMLKRMMGFGCVVCAVLGLACSGSMAGIIFEVDHNNLPAVGDPVNTWDDFTKSGGSPVVVDLGGEKWYSNSSATSDVMRHNDGPFAAPIPIDGATIVTAIKPIRGAGGDPWNSVVDIFYDQLCIGVHNGTGRIKVKIIIRGLSKSSGAV